MWNEKNEKILRQMWPKYSAKYIAQVLGMTKNSVAGKANRLKLKKDMPSQITLNPPKNKRAFAPWTSDQMRVYNDMIKKTIDPVAIMAEVNKHGPVRTIRAIQSRLRESGFRNPKGQQSYTPNLALERVPEVPEKNQCHWPIGDVGAIDFHFCCGKVFKRSYCKEHYDIAYFKPSEEDLKDGTGYCI